MSENPVAVTQALEDWALNVRLECLGSRDEKIEMVMGGAVLDLRDLDKILESTLAAGLEREADGAPGGESSITDDQIDAAVRHGFGDRIADAMASVSGEVVVPREPTEAMLDEACGISIAVYPTNIPSGWTALNHDEARELWAALLAAAPEAATPSALGGVDRMREALEKLSEAVTLRALRGRDHVPSMRDEQEALALARAALASGETSPDRGRGE